MELKLCFFAAWLLVIRVGGEIASTTPGPAPTTTTAVHSSTEHSAPAPESSSTSGDRSRVTKHPSKLGDCTGYCGIGFCECGSAVGCRDGSFGCGASSNGKECYCDAYCEREGTCCPNYYDVCTASVTEESKSTAVDIGVWESNACQLPCLDET